MAPVTGLNFRILGPLEVQAPAGAPLELGVRKQRAVLALLLDPGRVVSLERIINGLWAGEAPSSATGTLQVYISQLRRVLEPDRPPLTPPALTGGGISFPATHAAEVLHAYRRWAPTLPERMNTSLAMLLTNWRSADRDRLLRVKRSYDPTNVFSTNQAIVG